MTSALLRLAVRRSLSTVRHVAPVPPRVATGLVRRVYADVERDFGVLAPPVALHAPAPVLLAASWVLLRETLVADGVTGRPAREAVAVAVSADNACPYCVEVHTAALAGLAGPAGTLATDPRRAGDLPDDQATELRAVALAFHYLNRMVNVFLGESPLPPRAPEPVRRRARGMLGGAMRPAAERGAVPGAALSLLPPAPLPADLAWAAGRPAVAEALARVASVVDVAAVRVIRPPVRRAVEGALAQWSGGPPGISRAWVERPLAGVPAEDRPVARLALLTALAAYQVDRAVVDDARRTCRTDDALLAVASWASLRAARRAALLDEVFAEDEVVAEGERS
jgi:hypothetical protein